MAAPPGQFITLQAINALKETISGQVWTNWLNRCTNFMGQNLESKVQKLKLSSDLIWNMPLDKYTISHLTL